MLPGVDYVTCEFVGNSFPALALCDTVCKWCAKSQKFKDAVDSSGNNTSSSSEGERLLSGFGEPFEDLSSTNSIASDHRSWSESQSVNFCVPGRFRWGTEGFHTEIGFSLTALICVTPFTARDNMPTSLARSPRLSTVPCPRCCYVGFRIYSFG